MPDREKVIKGLECCLGANDCDVEPEEDCPYKGMCLCAMALRFDVFSLLKEQEETEWEHLWDAPDGTFKGRCKKCGFVHYFIEAHDAQYCYCPACGRSVKRE